jgi:molybdate/tungstate transport system substrate-binding protein
MKPPYWVALAALVALIVIPSVYLSLDNDRTTVRVLCAGSLIVPFTEMEAEFEKLHPDIDVFIDGHGSIQVIRYVTELYQEADVMAVADYSLIPMLMYQTQMPDSEESYADWCVRFTTNTLGIAYSTSSRYADEITADNWYEILARPDVTFGLSDARFDACGYRAMMVCQLAEPHYSDPDIFDTLLGNAFTWPITVIEYDGTYTIMVPEILEPASQEVALRGASIWLLFLIESGDVDYSFQYQSVAEQHGLEFLELPDEINLGSANYTEFYGKVRLKLAFRRFQSVEPEFVGQPIAYGITIPNNAPHPDIAEQFVEFVLSAPGQAILLEQCQPPVVPATVDNPQALPDGLAPLFE